MMLSFPYALHDPCVLSVLLSWVRLTVPDLLTLKSLLYMQLEELHPNIMISSWCV